MSKLAQADKAKLKVLNTEAATLTSQYNQRLLAANKSGGLVVNDFAQLAGMSEQEIALAAEAAREKGLDNKWLIPLLNTTQQPALAEMRDRATREKLFIAGWTRAEKNDANDTRAIIQRLVEIRAQQAKLLGFPHYAAFPGKDPPRTGRTGERGAGPGGAGRWRGGGPGCHPPRSGWSGGPRRRGSGG